MAINGPESHRESLTARYEGAVHPDLKMITFILKTECYLYKQINNIYFLNPHNRYHTVKFQ